MVFAENTNLYSFMHSLYCLSRGDMGGPLIIQAREPLNTLDIVVVYFDQHLGKVPQNNAKCWNFYKLQWILWKFQRKKENNYLAFLFIQTYTSDYVSRLLSINFKDQSDPGYFTCYIFIRILKSRSIMWGSPKWAKCLICHDTHKKLWFPNFREF